MKRGSRSGLTLVEVMVSSFILSVAASAILLGLIVSLSGGKVSQERTLAQMLATSVVEELRAHEYGTVTPPPDWKVENGEWTRTERVESIIDGLSSPVDYKMRVTPVESDSLGYDEVVVTLSWMEPTGPSRMQFKLAMESGWNVPVKRSSQPGKVSSSWHEPKKYTISSEPSYKVGSNSHTVNSDTSSSTDIINNDTADYQALYNQLSQANLQLDQDQDKVEQDQQDISATQSQLKQANKADPPDQAQIDALNAQLQAQQQQLAKDQKAVESDQSQVDSIQAQIDALDAKG